MTGLTPIPWAFCSSNCSWIQLAVGPTNLHSMQHACFDSPAYIYLHRRTHTYTHTHAHTQTQLHTTTHTRAHTNTHTRAHTNAYTRAHMHADTHAYTYTYTHTHISYIHNCHTYISSMHTDMLLYVRACNCRYYEYMCIHLHTCTILI